MATSLKRGKETPEYQAMVECNDYITNGLKANLVTMSAALHRKHLIPQSVDEEIIEQADGIDSLHKAAKLRELVTHKVQEDVVMFKTFLEILEQNEAEGLAKILKDKCVELQGMNIL